MLPDFVEEPIQKAHYAASATKLPQRVTMISIHRRRPRGYWIRVWQKRGGTSTPKDLHHRTSLKTARSMIPTGMTVYPRSDGDADDLVEVWR